MENQLWDLPSAYNVGDEVCFQFGESNPIVRNCHVTKVLFTRDKVFYDLQVAIMALGETDDGLRRTCIGHTRIHSIDSSFVYPHDHNHKIWITRMEYPDTDRLVDCRTTSGHPSGFRAFVKWDGSGIEWFYESGRPIRDEVKFEWSEIK